MIEIRELKFAFGPIKAVEGVSLDIAKGEIFGFLGPNGAGKTTLLSVLCTLLAPDGGTAAVMGNDVVKQASEIRKSIGVVFQDKSLDEKLTGRENLEISAALYSVPKTRRKEKIDELLDGFGLADRANSPVRTYSMGMRRRLEIARALIHTPPVLFLDEPTLGLDPKAREWAWDHLLALNKKEGTTIVLATNYMEEAERLCTRVGVVDEGKVIALGTPEELKGGLEGDVVALASRGPKKEIADKFDGIDFIKDKKIIKEKIIFIVENPESAVPRIVEIAGPENVISIELHRPTLNDVFLHLTGKEIKKEEEPEKKPQRKMKGKRRGAM